MTESVEVAVDDSMKVDGTETFASPDDIFKAGKEEGVKLPKPKGMSAQLIVFPIVKVHDILADNSGYEGWRVTEDEKQYWTYLAEFAMENLPMKYLLPLIMFGGLAVIEARKFMGYQRWAKAHNAPTNDPTRNPTHENAPPGPPTGAI